MYTKVYVSHTIFKCWWIFFEDSTAFEIDNTGIAMVDYKNAYATDYNFNFWSHHEFFMSNPSYRSEVESDLQQIISYRNLYFEGQLFYFNTIFKIQTPNVHIILENVTFS